MDMEAFLSWRLMRGSLGKPSSSAQNSCFSARHSQKPKTKLCSAPWSSRHIQVGFRVSLECLLLVCSFGPSKGKNPPKTNPERCSNLKMLNYGQPASRTTSLGVSEICVPSNFSETLEIWQPLLYFNRTWSHGVERSGKSLETGSSIQPSSVSLCSLLISPP